ncbi:3'-5' exonuclease [Streptomyces naphthomycinicus]|uniref:3'-5' exonuclease n=1 Tax=Streptomyces naphthomycinicus TaxID=2872625 RepID=UPI001CED48DA|nr:3'-5' exonuclease [Streptomyces sp. TML10]
MVDGLPVRLVRPSDTERPTWSVYQHERYLGTVHARPDGDGLWHVQSAAEQCRSLDDAVRMLRRPSSWSRQRQRVAYWAHAVLADPALLVIDVQTAGLGARAWAVQVAVLDGRGRTLVDELVDPGEPITAAASGLHGITCSHVARAPRFPDLLPELTGVVAGRRCVAYNARFDSRCPGPGTAAPPCRRLVGAGLAGRKSLGGCYGACRGGRGAVGSRSFAVPLSALGWPL